MAHKKSSVDRLVCVDVNECRYPGICPSLATCRNTFGSYECHCIPGSVLQDGNCIGPNYDFSSSSTQHYSGRTVGTALTIVSQSVCQSVCLSVRTRPVAGPLRLVWPLWRPRQHESMLEAWGPPCPATSRDRGLGEVLGGGGFKLRTILHHEGTFSHKMVINIWSLSRLRHLL